MMRAAPKTEQLTESDLQGFNTWLIRHEPDGLSLNALKKPRCLRDLRNIE